MNITIQANRLFGEKTPDNLIGQEKHKTSFYAGNTNLAKDPMEQKRKEAQEMAMKVVRDAWDTDKSIEKMIDDRKNHYAEQQKIYEENRQKVAEIEEQQNAIKESYGVTDETQEWYWNHNEEYRMRMGELNEQKKAFLKEMNNASKSMKDDIADVKEIRKAQLKADPMIEASKNAEEIMEAANEQIIGLALQESKELVDEKMKEVEEKAKEKAEEKKEKETQIAEMQQKRAIKEALIEGSEEAVERAKAKLRRSERAETDYLEMMDFISISNIQHTDVQADLDEIKSNMNLLEADLKGIEVDEQV